jgi:hypothetical protein
MDRVEAAKDWQRKRRHEVSRHDRGGAAREEGQGFPASAARSEVIPSSGMFSVVPQALPYSASKSCRGNPQFAQGKRTLWVAVGRG